MGIIALWIGLAWGATLDVDSTDDGYAPSAVTIEQGDEVRWFFTGPDAHGTTAVAGAEEWWDSGVLPAGVYWAHGFEGLGTFTYFCPAHGEDLGDGTATGHTATVTVVAPSPDSDGDGLSDVHEAWYGADPALPDTDGDGLTDGDEVLVHGTSPLAADTDGDGLDDADEVGRGTSPVAPDTDGDGLTDGDEVLLHGTDPLDDDTDAGGEEDGVELARGSDPLDPADDFRALRLIPPDAVVTDTPNRFGVVNGTPTAPVLLLVGRYAGETRVDGCPDLVVPLSSPMVVEDGWASRSGRARLEVFIPGFVTGEVLGFAAIQLDSCRISALEIVRVP